MSGRAVGLGRTHVSNRRRTHLRHHRHTPCTTSSYCKTGAIKWWDWEERMWYLANLFRFLHEDLLIKGEPATRSLSDQRFVLYEMGVIEKFHVR
jgi:hypothetical protein